MSVLTDIDVAELRAAFPYFSDPPTSDGHPVAYLDAAATSQRPARVLDAERSFLATANAAVHRGTSQAVGTATELFERARRTVAEFVGAATPEQIVWAENATDALNIVALGIGEANAGLGVPGSDVYALGPGDEILVTEAEHHANLIPWQRLAAKTGARLRYIPVGEYGTWTLDDARAAAIYGQAFGANPEFYAFYRSLEAYRASFKDKSDVLVVEPNSEFFKYLKNSGRGK